jgi:hypothetical protein
MPITLFAGVLPGRFEGPFPSLCRPLDLKSRSYIARSPKRQAETPGFAFVSAALMLALEGWIDALALMRRAVDYPKPIR